MRRVLLFPFRFLYCTYALLVFIVGILCVLPFVAVFSLQEQPKGGNRIYAACRWWDTAWLTLIGIRHQNVYESTPDADRQYIFISNHISYLDIPMILQAVKRDSLRILGKIEIDRKSVV